MLLEEERHLAAERGVPGPALVLDGLAVHADGDAAAEAAGAALVAVRLVDEAAALRLGLAHVLPVPPDRALEIRGRKDSMNDDFVPQQVDII